MRIVQEGNLLVISDDGSHVAAIRELPGRRWHGESRSWHVPYVKEVWMAMQKARFPIGHLKPPGQTGYLIDRPHGKTYLMVRTLGTPNDISRCKKIPEGRSYSTQLGAWLCRPNQANVEYLRRAFPEATWTDSAEQLYISLTRQVSGFVAGSIVRSSRMSGAPSPILDFKFQTKPYSHQEEAFARARLQQHFALLMEQGTGKTKVAIDRMADLALQGQIEAAVVVCPNGVKETWGEELDTHMPPWVPCELLIWDYLSRHRLEEFTYEKPKPGSLKILVVNVEALSHRKAAELVWKFAAAHKTLAIVDESSRIKSPNAARTKACFKLRDYCQYRMIMSGTPVTQGPLDLFAQFKFLDPSILGYGSFWSFRNRYAIMGGWNGKQVIGYVNLEELQALVDARAFRVTKAECLDLPEKIYQKRHVELAPEQRRIYDQMRDEMLAEMGEQTIEVRHAIVQMTRLQQIVGGFLPVDEVDDDGVLLGRTPTPIPGENPKLQELLEICDEIPGKIVIWARFRPELALISRTLREHYGPNSVAELHGGVQQSDRDIGRRAFQDAHSAVRFLVGQPEAGGIGITLTASSTVVYYSNSFNLEARLQSEDRNHRIGQRHPVTYIDLVAKGTLDARVLGALRGKKNLADLITGDPTLSWI